MQHVQSRLAAPPACDALAPCFAGHARGHARRARAPGLSQASALRQLAPAGAARPSCTRPTRRPGRAAAGPPGERRRPGSRAPRSRPSAAAPAAGAPPRGACTRRARGTWGGDRPGKARGRARRGTCSLGRCGAQPGVRFVQRRSPQRLSAALPFNACLCTRPLVPKEQGGHSLYHLPADSARAGPAHVRELSQERHPIGGARRERPELPDERLGGAEGVRCVKRGDAWRAGRGGKPQQAAQPHRSGLLLLRAVRPSARCVQLVPRRAAGLQGMRLRRACGDSPASTNSDMSSIAGPPAVRSVTGSPRCLPSSCQQPLITCGG